MTDDKPTIFDLYATARDMINHADDKKELIRLHIRYFNYDPAPEQWEYSEP